MTDTPARLAKLGELGEAASPGPWEVSHWRSGGRREREYYSVISAPPVTGSACVASMYTAIDTSPEANAQLTAQAPALAASVCALGAALEGLWTQCKHECAPEFCPHAIAERALATIPDLEKE